MTFKNPCTAGSDFAVIVPDPDQALTDYEYVLFSPEVFFDIGVTFSLKLYDGHGTEISHSLCGAIEVSAKFENVLDDPATTLIDESVLSKIDATGTYPLSFDLARADEFRIFWDQEQKTPKEYVDTTRKYALCAALATYTDRV